MVSFPWKKKREEKKKKDGKSADTAGRLDRLNLPDFMRTGEAYQVITGPVLLEEETRARHDKNFVFLYRIRNLVGREEFFYVQAPIRLPRQFLVERIVIGCSWYKYVPINTSDTKAEHEAFLRIKASHLCAS